MRQVHWPHICTEFTSKIHVLFLDYFFSSVHLNSTTNFHKTGLHHNIFDFLKSSIDVKNKKFWIYYEY